MKNNRIAFTITLINLVVLSVMLFQGSSSTMKPGQVVRARLFEVVDEKGTVRAQIKVESNPDAVVLRLRDANGNVRVKLGADSDGSGMVLANGSTEPGVHILSKDDNVKLALTDKNGRQRLITP
ncbi:MAG: hypothetical protein L0Y80_10595 [Ignavibacteriae bacterium]|nr:hypothetical protein [Ignavibacteriota bacterium]MCI0707918.1 hypothetical protein [Ignavibacteriota bacterium]